MLSYQDLAREIIVKYHLDHALVIRAIDIAETRGMIYNAKCAPGTYDVRAHDGTGWYHVALKSCTCKASRTGHICKHRVAVWLYTELIARVHASVRHVDPSVIRREMGYDATKTIRRYEP